MNPLVIQSKNNGTPEIILDKQTGKFQISGWSHPEDAIKFYTPILDWLNAYAENPNRETVFHFKFQYYNSSSSKQILRILSLLEEGSKKSKIEIYWHYDAKDTDMVSSGEGFSKMCTIPFKFILK